MKEIVKYQAIDGKIFETAEETYIHELKLLDEEKHFSSKIVFIDNYFKKPIPFYLLAENFEDISAIVIKENFDFEELYKELETISNEDYDYLFVKTIIDHFNGIPMKLNEGIWVQNQTNWTWQNLKSVLQITQKEVDNLINLSEMR